MNWPRRDRLRLQSYPKASWRNRLSRWLRVRLLVLAALTAAVFVTNSCATAPPAQQDNLCSIFKEKPRWFKATANSEGRWGVPIAVQMAFVQRESSFDSHARPPRKKILGVVPWKRPSSAYGYAQALSSTWSSYQSATRSPLADRNNFSDAVDFIGWYNTVSHKKLGIAKNNAEQLYLAYHEGQTGYSRGTYRKKPDVQRYAAKVAHRASRYQSQLNGCRKRLERKRRWLFF